jgi:hypothetical protein
MAATATLVYIGPQPVDTTQNEFFAKFQIKFSGVYSAANNHGDILNLISALIPSGRVPTQVDFYEQPPAGTAPTGYDFYYCAGKDLSSGQICVMQGSSAAPNSEISQNANYPAALTGTTYIYGIAMIPSY